MVGFEPIIKQSKYKLVIQAGEEFVIFFRQIKWMGRLAIGVQDLVVLPPELPDE